MSKTTRRVMLGAISAAALALTSGPLAAAPKDTAQADRWQIPVHTKKLANGLTVVVSPDASSPTVGVSVVYKVGMRLEPRNRTGFAHLFEHLMFQGTPKAPKGVFDQVITSGGGNNNGSTRPDFTNYIETAPSSALESMLWLEADRMTTLDFNPTTLKNQQDVVKEEIRVNVQNQPYGGFMWLDISDLAFDKWENKHDGYGSFVDLENANLDDVRAFHRDFYGPNNAVLSIAGDVTPAQGRAADAQAHRLQRRPQHQGAPPDPARQAGPGAGHRRGVEAAQPRQQGPARLRRARPAAGRRRRVAPVPGPRQGPRAGAERELAVRPDQHLGVRRPEPVHRVRAVQADDQRRRAAGRHRRGSGPRREGRRR
jgi:hypothetical protein